ncbi:MAG TPA: hypothetical protein VGD50_03950, partial [Candidatus Baltobacteraceae bacterium]
RRVTLAFIALALVVSACGRQVTPEPVNNGLSGEMSVTFQVSGPIDLNNINYLIVLNTSGQGSEPYANTFATSLCNYSFVFRVGPVAGNFGGVALQQFYVTPGATVPSFNWVNLEPGTTNIIQPSNNSFTLTFARNQLDIPSPVTGGQNPCVTATAAPSATPTASPTPTPTAPGATPTPVGSPTASPTPVPSPTTLAQSIWYMNLITTQGGVATTQGGTVLPEIPLDALGYGVTDQSYVLELPVSTAFSITQATTPGGIPPSNVSALITGFTVINTP